MSTYGTQTVNEGQKESVRKYRKVGKGLVKKNCYLTPVFNHFDYRHAVDDCTNLCHSFPAIEST